MSPRTATITPRSIVVCNDSLEEEAIVESNCAFVSLLRTNHFRLNEISEDALRSYYVESLQNEILNGGYSQFFYNLVRDTRDYEVFLLILKRINIGMKAMGIVTAREAFLNAYQNAFDILGDKRLAKFVKSEYWGENKERDILNSCGEELALLLDTEDVRGHNARWLKAHPDLVVLTLEEMKEEIQRRITNCHDMQERIARSLENELLAFRLIRKLCKEMGIEYEMRTGGNPTHVYQGRQVTSWYFKTSQGFFYLIETKRSVLMFSAENHQLVGSIAVPGSDEGLFTKLFSWFGSFFNVK